MDSIFGNDSVLLKKKHVSTIISVSFLNRWGN